VLDQRFDGRLTSREKVEHGTPVRIGDRVGKL
jgi:hypothetical protein